MFADLSVAFATSPQQTSAGPALWDRRLHYLFVDGRTAAFLTLLIE